MKIILNAETLNHPLTGIGYYTWHLLQGLRFNEQIEQVITWPIAVNNDRSLSSSLYSRSKNKLKQWFQYLPHSHRLLHYGRNQFFKQTTHHLAKQRFLYHEPCYILQPFQGPKVCNVHDLSVIYYPQYHPKARVKNLLHYLPLSVTSSDHIITGSQFIREEIINTFKISSNKVTCVYNGVSNLFKLRSQTETKTVLMNYGLIDKPYLLYVGTLEPRKNLERLLLAFKSLSEQQRRRHPFVFVGPKGWDYIQLEKLMAPLIRAEELYYLDYVPTIDLPFIYSGAYGFVYLSIYEGFGLPLLEALSSGIPTLASNVSSIPEVVGDAALLSDPWEIPSIADKLDQLINDVSLRNTLKEKGPKQAMGFSWRKCVHDTIKVYKRVLEKDPASRD